MGGYHTMKKYNLMLLIFGLILLCSCRNDTGSNTTPQPLYSPASSGAIYCANPAPLNGQYDPAAPNYIIVFNAGTNSVAEVNRLASIYDMKVGYIYEVALLGFSAQMSGETREQLRCEVSVNYIAYDGLVYLD